MGKTMKNLAVNGIGGHNVIILQVVKQPEMGVINGHDKLRSVDLEIESCM